MLDGRIRTGSMRPGHRPLVITTPTTLGKRGGRHVERAVFLPEPGEALLVIDLSQIDARAVAAHSQDPGFRALFEDGRDFHTQVATRILGDPAKREVAKTLNHSVNYGVGARKLASMADVPLPVAEDYLRGMAAQYPQWAAWKQAVVEAAPPVNCPTTASDANCGSTPTVRDRRPAAIGQARARDLLMDGILRVDAAGPNTCGASSTTRSSSASPPRRCRTGRVQHLHPGLGRTAPPIKDGPSRPA